MLGIVELEEESVRFTLKIRFNTGTTLSVAIAK